MTRRTRMLVVALVVALAGCFSGEPKVAEADQVPAAQAEALAASEQASEGAGGAGGGEGGEELAFVAVDIDYADAPDSAPAGPLTFVLENQGASVHDVVIEETGDTLVVAAEGGETASGNITLESGSYTYYCSVPGHRGAGMEGTLEVQ